ncbi:uncharacterized protein LOC119090163 [Pollicipes pollicipes]|uniref:uncharacterized protein LOC119090163 n=1 Tax=Pollicipes pollicipes TaxID=41117 RepID=UPI0018855E7E|nr:uncharacterized protein LOC119090163 [Pollicipes pollicipes]
MPHVFSPQSLEDLCFKNIGHNMDDLWCKDYNENFHGKGECLYLLGPFSNLPGLLLSKLIRYLKMHGLLKIGHLQLLLDFSLVDLDLSHVSKNMGTVMNTIVNRCVHLRHLDLSGNVKLPLQGQIALFSTARQLESINLASTNTSDRVMSVIGAYCLQLRELNVAQSGVTDLGLTSLSTAALSESSGAGASIVSLNVDGCSVSAQSAYAVLNTMPNITSLHHPETVVGVEQLLLRRPERAPLALTELHGSSALSHVCLQHCAALTDALLERTLDAGGLSRLRRLSLESCDEFSLDSALRLVVQCTLLEELGDPMLLNWRTGSNF